MSGLPYLKKLSLDDFEISVILSLRVIKYGNICQKSWELNKRTFSFKASCEGQGTEGGEDGTDAGTAARTVVDPMDRDPAFIVYVAAITAAVGGLLFGYNMGTVVNNFNDGGLRPSLFQLT